MSININHSNSPCSVYVTPNQGKPCIIKDTDILKDVSACLTKLPSEQHSRNSLSILTNDAIHEIYQKFLLGTDDMKSLNALAATCRRFHLLEISFIQSILPNTKLENICPKLYMIDTQMLCNTSSDPIKINVLKLIKAYRKIASHVENDGALTLLVLRQGTTAHQIINGKPCYGWTYLSDMLGNPVVENTCVGLMTNHVIKNTRNLTAHEQENKLRKLGCTMPPLLAYFMVCSAPDGNTYPKETLRSTYGISSDKIKDDNGQTFLCVAGNCNTVNKIFTAMSCDPNKKSETRGAGAWKQL
jgi:hypothetical protein